MFRDVLKQKFVVSPFYVYCVFFQLLLSQNCLRLYFCVHRHTLSSSTVYVHVVLMSHVCAITY